MVHRSINFLTFNVQSLIDSSRQIDLQNTLLNNHIDIGFIQECHVMNRKVHIEGYNFLSDYSPPGVAIAIKKSLQYKRISIKDLGFKTSFIQIESNQNSTSEKYLIGSLYIPCNTSTITLNESLNKFLQATAAFDGFIVGGDLNAKNVVWGDTRDNRNGTTLNTWLQNNTMEVVRLCDSNPSFPRGTSFLDHFLLSENLIDRYIPNFNITSLPTFSDHYPLKLELRLSSFSLTLRNPRHFTSYKNTNWSHFRHDMEAATLCIMPPVNRNLSNNEVDSLIDELNAAFSSVHEAHSEKFEISKQKRPLSAHIKRLYKIKYCWQKELKKIYHRTGNRLSREYNILSKQIQLLKIIIKEAVNIEQAKHFNERLQKIKPSPSAFQKIFQIVGKNKSSFCHKIRYNDTITTDTSEMSELFQNFYSAVFRPSIVEHPVPDLEAKVSSCVNSISPHIYTFNENFTSLYNPDTYHFVKTDKIRNIISNINNKKSSGFDYFSNYIIRRLPDVTLKLLTILFNNCINNCYFPKSWKSAKIIPIKKKTNSMSLADFRPISLLSNIGKLFEHVLKEKIENDFIIEPISQLQFGFKKGHSTQHALLKFHSDLTDNLRNKNCTVAISLDIEKAFDSACHKGILYKLIDLGVDPFLVKTLQSFFSDRTFNVQISESTSTSGIVNSGVPQGSVLAPLLFNLFLNDFPHLSENSKAILYADDCMIYAHNNSPAQALNHAAFHLGLISVYYKTWGIKINAAKSQAICIRNASGKCARFVVPESKALKLSLDGVDIPFTSEIKYLGVNFNMLLKFNKHARSLVQKAKRLLGMFSYILNNKYLPINTKLLLYKVAIRSVLVYGFPIWFTISPTVANELEIFERKVLRKCVNKNYENLTKRFSNTHIYETAKVQPFCKYALNLQLRFVEKLETHENSLMNDIFEAEKILSWSEQDYLSPVGVLNEVLDDDPDPYSVPAFFNKTVQDCHRG